MDQCKRIGLRQFALQISNKCCPHGQSPRIGRWVSYAESGSAADLEVGIHGVLHSKCCEVSTSARTGYTMLHIYVYKQLWISMNLRHLQVCANVSIHGVASPRNGGKSEENRRPKESHEARGRFSTCWKGEAKNRVVVNHGKLNNRTPMGGWLWYCYVLLLIMKYVNLVLHRFTHASHDPKNDNHITRWYDTQRPRPLRISLSSRHELLSRTFCHSNDHEVLQRSAERAGHVWAHGWARSLHKAPVTNFTSESRT